MTSARLNRGLSLTELGFGGAQIGNLYRATTDQEAAAAVAAAWDAGIRYFDTAPHYGLGLSERRPVTHCGTIRATTSCRPRPTGCWNLLAARVIRTRRGFAVPATHRRVRDYSRDGVLRSIEGSLERLGLDRIDLVLIHDPDDYDHAWPGSTPRAQHTRAVRTVDLPGHQPRLDSNRIRLYRHQRCLRASATALPRRSSTT